MPSKLCLDRLGNLALLQIESSPLEFPDHLAPAECSQIPAFPFGRAERFFRCNLGETFALVQLVENKLRFLLCLDKDVRTVNFVSHIILIILGPINYL